VPGVNDRIAAAWKKAYPDINREIIRVLNEMDSKLEAERTTGASGADVGAHVNYPYALASQDKGYWVKFTGPDVNNAKWQGLKDKFIFDNNIIVPVLTSIVITYNTNFVRGGLKDYRDLLKRDYAGGQIGLPDPLSPAVADFYAWLEDKYGADFLTKLAAQKPVIYSSAVPLEQGLIAGEVSIAAYATSVGTLDTIAKGAQMKFVVPEDAWGAPVYTYIPKWAKHPNAAQVLVNWMASPAGQDVMGQDQYSPLDGKGVIGPIAKMTPINVKRTVTAGWYDTFFAKWKTTFGRK
jgi:iron(III) transport system substrate-binding protein